MTITEPTWTVLELTGMGVVPYSSRKAQQTLEPIAQAGANIKRDVNGGLHVLGGSQFQKYKSTITCTDQRPFASDGVWPGKVVTVSCIAELAYQGASASPERTPVAGSTYTEGEGEHQWFFYRPQLVMMIRSFRLNYDEYGAEVGWTMELEEV